MIMLTYILKIGTLIAWGVLIGLLIGDLVKGDVSADNNISQVLYDANTTGDPYEKHRLLHSSTSR